MQCKINGNTIEITCTFDELCVLDSLGLRIWAVPKTTQLYPAAQAQWRDDIIIATVDDFCEEEGWTTLGWEEMSEEDRDHVANDETTITKHLPWAL